jgi:AraC family transcriptional regulator
VNLSLQNANNNNRVFDQSVRGNQYGAPHFSSSVQDHFDYNVSEAGRAVLIPDQTTAIILLEPVRQLHWIIDDREDVVSSCAAGKIFFIPARQRITIIWSQPADYLQLTIPERLTTYDLSQPGDAAASGCGVISFNSKQCLQVSQLITGQLKMDARRNEHYLAALHSVLLHLLHQNTMTAPQTPSRQPGLTPFAANRIEAYLNENFQQVVSVADMAALLGLSVGHFATSFRITFGQTPHQYLMTLRLDDAERCLKETDMSFYSIAQRLKFSSQSHLTSALRKYRQRTPGEIRSKRRH